VDFYATNVLAVFQDSVAKDLSNEPCRLRPVVQLRGIPRPLCDRLTQHIQKPATISIRRVPPNFERPFRNQLAPRDLGLYCAVRQDSHQEGGYHRRRPFLLGFSSAARSSS